MQQQKFWTISTGSVNQNFENSPIIQYLNIAFCDIIEITDPLLIEGGKQQNSLRIVQNGKEREVRIIPLGWHGWPLPAISWTTVPATVFDINRTVKRVLNADFAIDHSAQAGENSKSITYPLSGDNAGEIISTG